MKYLTELSLILILCFTSIQSKADNFGAKVGAIVQFGTHIQRIGLTYQIYYSNNFYQLNQGSAYYFCKKELGPPLPCKEFQSFAGLQLAYNKANINTFFFLNEYSRLTHKNNSIGYIFRYYHNNINTSQTTGELLFSAHNFSFIFQNDILGFFKGHQDKYRTGAVSFLINNNKFQYAISTTMWTGNCSKAKKFKVTDYPSRYGYKDLRNAPYGIYSHGILSFRINYLGTYQQSYYTEIGIDAEQVRHALQNRLIHDMIIRRKTSTLPGNPHVPMLQKDGTPFLFKKDQKVRPAKLFLQGGVNAYYFY